MKRDSNLISNVVVVVAITLFLASPVNADQGDWLVRVGANIIMPKSDNGDIVEVENGTMLTFNGSYFVTDNWAVELLAALPFTHDIELIGGSKVGETKHLPPTLSVQYHFLPDGQWRPYVGAGINYTLFFEEDTQEKAMSVFTAEDSAVLRKIGINVVVLVGVAFALVAAVVIIA